MKMEQVYWMVLPVQCTCLCLEETCLQAVCGSSGATCGHRGGERGNVGRLLTILPPSYGHLGGIYCVLVA